MDIGTDREDRDVILGSAPIASALEAPPGLSFAPLRFDPREFMQFVEDEDLSEVEAERLLRAIWEVVVAFVDLGFGVDTVPHPVDGPDDDGGTSSSGSAALLSCSDNFSNSIKSETAEGDTRATAAEED